MEGDFSGSSTWLAAAGELRQLHEDPSSHQYQPPPTPPSEDEVVQLEAVLLERGLFISIVDPVSKNVFYVDLATGRRTWSLHALCQVLYYDLRERLQTFNPPQHVAAAVPLGTQSKKGNSSPRPNQSTPRKGAAGSPSRRLTPAQWRYKIIELYKTHDPSKVQLVDELLARYFGQEEELWGQLKAKYSSPRGVVCRVPSPTTKRSANTSTASQRLPSPLRDAEELNEHDVYMHRHHGDTHGVSYRSCSGGSAGGSPPAAVRGGPPKPTPNEGSQGSRSRAVDYASLAPDLAVIVQTPDVSTIGADSDVDIEEHRKALADARAIAEDKASKVLQAAQQHHRKRAVAPHTDAPLSGKKLWSQELHRRDEEAVTRRNTILQEKERAKNKREADLRRRSEELKRIREREQQLRMQEAELTSTAKTYSSHQKQDGTPRRTSAERHKDPIASPTSTKPAYRQSPMRASPRVASTARSKTAAEDMHSPPSAVSASIPVDTTPGRKLSASEQRSSVERLYSGQRK